MVNTLSNDQVAQLAATQAGPMSAADQKGDITRDEVLKRELLRQIIYTSTGQLSVGSRLAPTQQMNQLGLEFAMPGETTADYPVSNDTKGERRYIDWTEFKIRLERAQARYFVSDGAKLEGMIGPHMDAMARRTSEALARRKDENILGRIANGAPSENSDSAGTAWDQDVNVMIDELRKMWEWIVLNAPLNSLDVIDMTVVLPARVYTMLSELELINNVQQRVEENLAETFNFTFVPHKVGMHDDDQSLDQYGVNLQDVAIMLLPGEDTAVHGELSQSAAAAANVPLVEGPERDPQGGEDYFISQWFETNVMEQDGYGGGVNPRIAVMDGVNSESATDHVKA